MESKLKAGDLIEITEEDFGIPVGTVLPVVEVNPRTGGARVVNPTTGDPTDRAYFYASEFRKIADAPEATLPDTKATNPKDAIGSTKLPLDLVPDTLPVMAALAFTEGATKYGAYNWRVAGVRASIYRAALDRHLKKWWNGEDADPKTGVPHLASVIACAGIILDAALAGKLTDDRPPKVALGELIDSLEGKVKHLKELHKDMHPHHHTEADKLTKLDGAHVAEGH